jgi:hypothetical protein
MKKAYIIHGWDGYPESGWFPWLKQELEKRGWLVVVPQLPKPEEPRIKNWVPALTEIVGVADEQTYFVGHSMGCQTIARYLENLPEDASVGGAVFVAGFFKQLTNIENDEVTHSVVDEWLKTPINLKLVKKHLRKSVAIFSDNDPYVPLDNRDEFEKLLGSTIIVETNMQHFSGSTGTTELPVALNALLEIAG